MGQGRQVVEEAALATVDDEEVVDGRLATRPWLLLLLLLLDGNLHVGWGGAF